MAGRLEMGLDTHLYVYPGIVCLTVWWKIFDLERPIPVDIWFGIDN